MRRSIIFGDLMAHRSFLVAQSYCSVVSWITEVQTNCWMELSFPSCLYHYRCLLIPCMLLANAAIVTIGIISSVLIKW